MESIKVAIRIKPTPTTASCWALDQEQQAIRQYSNWVEAKSAPPALLSTFTFDKVFAQQDSTETVYHSFSNQIIQAAIGGINGTIFAYGQTSSGKTFTMQGIIRLAVRELFGYIEGNEEFSVRASYLEIYNEVITDLLNGENRNLKIHQKLNGEIFVGSATESHTSTEAELEELIQKGETNRTIGATSMNEKSSRSHAILRLTITRTQKEQGTITEATLNFVDLAGSERAGQTGAEGARLKEGGHINKSLLALSSVIGKLAEGADYANGHIPFRDSKLTRILQPFLGGNGQTFVICTVSLEEEFVDETLSTLKFASRAKCIQNRPVANVSVSSEAVARRLQGELIHLKEVVFSTLEDSGKLKEVKDEISVAKNALTLVKGDLLLNIQAFQTNFFKNSKKLQEKTVHLAAERDAYETCYMEIERDFNEKIGEFTSSKLEFESELKASKAECAELKAQLAEKTTTLAVHKRLLEEAKEEIQMCNEAHAAECSNLKGEISLLKKILAERDEQEARELEKVSTAKKEMLNEMDKRIGEMLVKLTESQSTAKQLQEQLLSRKEMLFLLHSQCAIMKEEVLKCSNQAKIQLHQQLKDHFEMQQNTLTQFWTEKNQALQYQIESSLKEKEVLTAQTQCLTDSLSLLTAEKEELSTQNSFLFQKISTLNGICSGTLASQLKETVSLSALSFHKMKSNLTCTIQSTFLAIQDKSKSAFSELNLKLEESSEKLRKLQAESQKKQLSFERYLKSLEAAQKPPTATDELHSENEANSSQHKQQPRILVPKKRKIE